MIVIMLVMITISVTANILVRNQQLTAWRSAPDVALFDGVPSFSTNDAPYFLQHAAIVKRGSSYQDAYSIRAFPNNMDILDRNADRPTLDLTPMLSKMLAILAVDDSPQQLMSAGNQLILITAGLTAFMIFLCFGATGYWLEGAVAGLGGGLSGAYLTRSSIGRIDTDQLNLGFTYLMFGMIVLVARTRTWTQGLLLSVAAGLCTNLFMSWYYKPELVIVAAVCLIWLMVCQNAGIARALVCAGIFAVGSGMTEALTLSPAYLQEKLGWMNFIFPNTSGTISELQTIPVIQILTNMTGSIEMAACCLAGLILFTIRHPATAIALAPLVMFALLNFIFGNRTIFYSAPIMWFGAAFLLTTLARFIASNLSDAGFTVLRDRVATTFGASLAMILAWVNSPIDYVPQPSFTKPVLEGLASLKTTTNPVNAVVATWWDYGYASMFFNSLPTFHDGGLQMTPSTHFVARAFLDPETTSTIGTLKFLSTRGHAGIAGETDLTGLNTAFRDAVSSPSLDLYLVVTNQMAGWMGSISKIGNWDIEKGEPIQLRGNPDGPEVHYKPINCRFNAYPRHLNCNGLKIDLERGLIDGQPLLVGWAHTKDGSVLRSRDFGRDTDHAIQIVQNGSRITAYLLHRQLYDSTFNRLYYLGDIDHPSISLHYDDYPHIRIYRIDGNPDG